MLEFHAAGPATHGDDEPRLAPAREAGTRHVLIVADEDDWPKELYERVGFDRIGRTWLFIREPKGKTAEPKS